MPGDVAKAYDGVTSFHQEAETLPTDLVFVAAFMNLWYIFGMPINDTLQGTVIGKDGPDERCSKLTRVTLHLCRILYVSFQGKNPQFPRNNFIFLSTSHVLFIQQFSSMTSSIYTAFILMPLMINLFRVLIKLDLVQRRFV